MPKPLYEKNFFNLFKLYSTITTTLEQKKVSLLKLSTLKSQAKCLQIDLQDLGLYKQADHIKNIIIPNIDLKLQTESLADIPKTVPTNYSKNKFEKGFFFNNRINTLRNRSLDKINSIAGLPVLNNYNKNKISQKSSVILYLKINLDKATKRESESQQKFKNLF